MKRLIITFLAALTVVVALAQETEKLSLSLSIDEANNYALEHNRAMKNASLSVKQSEAARWQAIASMLPQASASLDYVNMCGYETTMYGMPIPMNPYGQLGIKATWAVGGQQIVGALISDLAVEMSNIAVSKSEQVITSNVTTTYATILAMQETLDLLKKNQKNLQDLYEMTLNSVKVGVAEQIDADQLSVQVSSMESGINNTARNIEILYNTLRLLLGTSVDAEITLTSAISDIINIESAMELLSHDLVLGENYDYQLAKKNAELSKQQVTMAGMAFVPTLAAYYQYTGKTYFGEAEGMNTTPPNTVGVSLSIPIWSSGVRSAAVTEKKLAYQASQNDLLDTEDNLKLQDKQYRYNLVTAYENYEIQKRNITVTENVFTNISKKFEYGYSTSLDVTNASTNLINAQSNYISSVLEMVQAHIKLKDLLNK